MDCQVHQNKQNPVSINTTKIVIIGLLVAADEKKLVKSFIVNNNNVQKFLHVFIVVKYM